MTIEQLRKVHQSQPFQPFAIYLADGRVLEVPHQEFLSHSPTGRTVIVHHEGDDYSVIDVMLITELRVRREKAQGKSKS